MNDFIKGEGSTDGARGLKGLMRYLYESHIFNTSLEGEYNEYYAQNARKAITNVPPPVLKVTVKVFVSTGAGLSLLVSPPGLGVTLLSLVDGVDDFASSSSSSPQELTASIPTHRNALNKKSLRFFMIIIVLIDTMLLGIEAYKYKNPLCIAFLS